MKEKAKSQSTEEIGRRLRELRERLNKNQAEMGRLLGLRKDAYGKYERQNSHPPFKVLSALAGSLKPEHHRTRGFYTFPPPPATFSSML
jgi:transcriptional regulator with XRE-family HTH domain